MLRKNTGDDRSPNMEAKERRKKVRVYLSDFLLDSDKVSEIR